MGVVLTDGAIREFAHFNPAVFVRHLVLSGRLKIGSIVKLNNFSVDEPMEFDSKRIIITEIDVIVKECDQIGEPIPLPNSAFSSDVDLTQGAMVVTIFDLEFIPDKFGLIEEVYKIPDETVTYGDLSYRCCAEVTVINF
ncbi:hypothetical protein MTR_4g064240 [Medicago truncatula]|uniref:Uncharacterized protein n=1 Tax=Medicago truncatula TaxID=3880 RepID=G7JUU4_MEDTR|nr:hypothetical protein MTR_4g064240 [Medicago truncatula]